MRIGYLMNTYPVTSATFIRREIAALEALGVDVSRFAIRPWDEALGRGRRPAEAARTHYLLAAGAVRLLGWRWQSVAQPARRVAGCGGPCGHGARGGAGALVRHVAYLLEAVHLKRASQGLRPYPRAFHHQHRRRGAAVSSHGRAGVFLYRAWAG